MTGKPQEKSGVRPLRATGPAAVTAELEQALGIKWDFNEQTRAAIEAVETAIRASDRQIKNFVLR